MKKAVVYGLGHCGSVVAKQLKSGLIDGVELVGVWSYTTSKAEAKEVIAKAGSILQCNRCRAKYRLEWCGSLYPVD